MNSRVGKEVNGRHSDLQRGHLGLGIMTESQRRHTKIGSNGAAGLLATQELTQIPEFLVRTLVSIV